jgi:hypothetical protein
MLRSGIADIRRRHIAGLEAEYDARNIAAIDYVLAWRDSSGKGRHALQTAYNSRPAWSATGMGNLPGVLFDGVNDSLVFDRFDLSNATVVAVVRREAGGVNGTVVDVIQSTTTRDAVTLSINDDSSNGPVLIGRNGDGNGYYQRGGLLKLGTPRLLIAQWNGTAYRAWDGATEITLANSTSKASAAAGTDSRIGAGWSSPAGSVTRHFTGAIGYLAIYSSILTDAQRALLTATIQSDWGLA